MAVFNYGLKSEYATDRTSTRSFALTSNPALLVPRLQGVEKPSNKLPTMQNLTMVWLHANEFGTEASSAALRFHIACGGIRVMESIQRRWDELVEVDGVRVLFIPNTKTGKPHLIPVGRHMATVIDEIRKLSGKCEVIFPGRFSEVTPVSFTAVSLTTFDLGDFGPRHVRAGAKSYMVDAGVPLDSLNVFHNHALTDIANRHYVKTHRLKDKIEVINTWDRLLGDAISNIQRKDMRAVR